VQTLRHPNPPFRQPLGRALGGVALALLAVSGSGRAQPASASYRSRRYVVRWTTSELEFCTPTQRVLSRWPVGVLCAPADPDQPATACMLHPNSLPVRSLVAGVPQLVWRWRFSAPAPLAEQRETYRLLPDRVEIEVQVRWRGEPSRLLRMNYGARLAAGCCDLEGLWRCSHASAEAPTWDVAPVPGVYTEVGDTWFRKRVRPSHSAEDLVLIAGGIDDGDVASWDDTEIGQTPTNVGEASWTKVRKYALPHRLLTAGMEQQLRLQVHNAAGNGGLWRGPLVLGPAATLEATPEGDGWTRATAVGSALYHWCPDTYRQPLRGRFTVSLTSRDRTREPVPENVTTGGRFLIPPHVAALEGANGWWGIGTLDVPRAEDGLRIEWRADTLSCPFLLATEPSTRAGQWTDGPTIALLAGSSKADVLATYLGALPPRESALRQDWWSGPCYCTWGDQVYGAQLGPGTDVGSLTETHLRQWLSELRDRAIHAPLVTLDAGWWQLPKAVVGELHAEGRHCTVWTQPHWGPDTTQHSERAVRDANDQPLTYDANNWILDYTSPAVREHTGNDFRSYVAADGWGTDGIKLDFCYTAAPVWAIHADPAWGAGEAYRARVLQFVYQTIKAARPDALVTGGTANPLFGRVQDVCRLNEDWVGDVNLFRQRAATVLALGEWVECDDWNAYEHYLAPQTVERPVWGTFTLMSARYRGDRGKTAVPLSPQWSARLSALTALAQRIPVRSGQRCLYDPAHGLLRRETRDGDLVATALPLVGSSLPLQVLVVSNKARMLVCAVADGEVRLPTDQPPRSVTAVLHDGTRRAEVLPKHRTAPVLRVQDCAGEVAWYEVGFTAWPGQHSQ